MDRAGWATQITTRWRAGVESIFATGAALIAAKADLPHGEFLAMVEADLPFSRWTARRLMAVAADGRLASDGALGPILPASWRTLYELTRLDDDALKRAVASGVVNPDMQRQDVTALVKRRGRAAREADLGARVAALPDKRYGVIVADPEWRFEPWSRATGMDRAADNHYPTSSLEVIAARDVGAIAADDCFLGLWATVPMLPHALVVMEAWGFDYRSHVVWKKDRMGTGYWFRNWHELLLIGVRGAVPAPAAGAQWDSVIEAGVAEHSAKPEEFLEMIEAYFPSVPKIELNRRGPARPGWDAWGLEAEAA